MRALQITAKYQELIEQFLLRPIHSEMHFEKAVKVMKSLAWRQNLTADEEDYLSVLGGLIAEYEKHQKEPSAEMSPAEALEYLMDINGLNQSDLAPIVGYKSNLSAFLAGKRGLSKAVALKLAERFKVSPAIFLG
jgi:HTH-type transcriptional regulator/antitoxin HigA